jgi:molecular chaperone DnaK
MTTAYGIDFGTTNSVLARLTGTGVETVPLADRLPAEWTSLGLDRVLPSVFALTGGRPLFGWPAKKQTRSRLEAVKRLFAVENVVTVGGETLPVEVAGALLFGHIKERAGDDTPLERAVVTIPANSRGLARARTKLAAGLAGIDVLALINEPTAAAMAHARTIGSDQRILVFDWGGGTLDVTVLLAFEGSFVEQASMGVQRLGGLDLDAAFMAALAPHVPGSDGWTEEERNAFRLDLELAKIQLSTAPTVEVTLPDGGTLEITREYFENAIRPLIERTREPVEVCLRESPGRIDHLVMVGGSSRIPLVQRFVTDLVGSEPNRDVDPMTAIAEGAAIAAGILQGTVEDIDFHVGAEHALGTLARDDDTGVSTFSVLIGRNTKFPARTTQVYTPVRDFQESVAIVVVEGNPAKPLDDDDNVVLMDWEIPLPERRPMAEAAINITYEYDVDGILHVLVQDVRTGAVLIDAQLASGTGRNPEQLEEMKKQVVALMSRPPAD